MVSSFIVLMLTLQCTDINTEIDDFNADIAIAWNKRILELAIEEDGLLTLKGVRTAAMAHIAMHDALNAIVPVYTHYAYSGDNSNADPLSSVVTAAYTVVLDQYPDKKSILIQERNRWLNKVAEGAAKSEGEKLGIKVAHSILEKRIADGWNKEAGYTWHPMGPGVYAEFNEHSGTPEGFIFGAGWAAAQPFMLPNQDYFRSPPPPDILSPAYTKAFNEVKEYGSYKSTKRSDDQSHMAMWWKDFVENSHNRLARNLIQKERLNLWEASRLFALLNMTVFDAYINVFDNKFFYNHWRPYTAIRWAANDGNPETIPDPEWNNLHQHTYAFPSYPSAHGTASTAAMTVLSNCLDVQKNYTFTMTTEKVDKAGPFSEKIEMIPPTRTFNSFSEAGLEAALSRIYLGIHFRYDSEEGYNLGSRIGAYAKENFLIPLLNE